MPKDQQCSPKSRFLETNAACSNEISISRKTINLVVLIQCINTLK